MATEFPIRLTEELILLMLDEHTGYMEMVPGWAFSCVIAGAVIADLSLEERLDSDLSTLYLVDASPTGDPMLDPTLKEIADAEESNDAQYWIERNTNRADDIVTTTLNRLVERKIVDYETGGFWGLSRSVARSGAYPSQDATVRQEARARVLDIILNDALPDPHDAILVALMHTCGGFKLLLDPEDYEEKLERIETIAKLDLIGRTVATAVQGGAARPKTRRVIQSRPIPQLGYQGLLRREFLTGNISKAMYGVFRDHGPVVQMPFKINKQTVVALMGVESNRWINKHGRFYLRSKDYIQELENAFGASRTLPGMDGAEHRRMRKSLSGAYSRGALAKRLPELFSTCRTSLGEWSEGSVVPVSTAFRDLISQQISRLMIGIEYTAHQSDELLEYEHRALMATVTGVLPKFMLKTPKMNRYGKRVAELRELIDASHTPGQRKGKPPDLADAILAVHREDPQFLPETDLTFPFAASMVASLYLGSGLGFAVYWMVTHPDIHEQVYREAEALFGNGREPSADDFSLENLDVTHRLCLESARMTPVIPWQMRTVVNHCIFNGHEVPARTRLLICQTVTHYDGDLFPEPEKFDIDRYLPERAEHTNPGAYAPWGLGTHTCLGSRWVELQMAVNILLMAWHLKLELTPADYELGINPLPTASPDKKMKLRVAEVRHPL